MAHFTGRLGLPAGNIGEPVSVVTNSFPVTTLPTKPVVHYDVFPDFEERPLKRDRALQIIDRLQIQQAILFNPRAAYDGQHNMFRAEPLALPNNAATFTVYMGATPTAAHPNVKGIKVRITRVAVIDPRSIHAVIRGNANYSSESLTTMTFLNILIRMKPILSYPSNAKSFFTKDIRESLGGGLELWRGFFQSVRPTLNRLLVNVDTSTAVMYSSGLLLDVIMAFQNVREPRDLAPNHVKPVEQAKLNKFLKNLLVSTIVPPPRQGRPPRYRRISNIVLTGADQYIFNDDDGERLSITAHFRRVHRYNVRFGGIICVDVGKGIVYPIEVLQVKEGQMYKKTLPSTLAPRALKFSTQKPSERVQAIQSGTQLLGYADSDFLRHAGMSIDPNLISIKARILPPPPIQWGGISRPDNPRGGAWNVLGKQLYKPGIVKAWAVVVYEPRTTPRQVQDFLKMFVHACVTLGMSFPDHPPELIPGRPGADSRGHCEDMEKAGMAAIQKFEGEFTSNELKRPTFILVILPDSAIDIRTSVKSWGDCIRGCPTQCMKSGKLAKANNQYCNNLALKLNTKIGGINSIPSGNVETMRWLTEKPTMIIGADVSHAGPDTDRPSITGFVSSVDENFCQYVANTRIQQARQEIISDLDIMIEKAIDNFHMFWKLTRDRNVLPHRIIFYRDGVSEGQFQAVGEKEVQQIKEYLPKLWQARKFPGAPPKLTFIIVAKRHHVRFFPKDSRDADRSGNCHPGLVVDQEIVSPVDYDFYLQSHGGLLGTSRPSHYSVIEDGNALGPNMVQAISYTLCHVYARATRSVSIPAPVYYADIVSARGRFHSRLIHDGGDSAGSVVSGDRFTFKEHQDAFMELADSMKRTMYFM